MRPGGSLGAPLEGFVMKNALAVLDKLVNTPLEEFDANTAALV